VYYADRRKRGVYSTGDNTSGEGIGDDEQLVVDLLEVPRAVTTLAFCVNIYTRNRNFGDVTNAYMRLFDTHSMHEYCKFSLNKEKLGEKTGVIFCMLQRGSDPLSWSVMSVGEPCNGNTVKEIRTSLWDGCWDGGSHLFEVDLLSNQDASAIRGAGTTTSTTINAAAENGCCTIQ
jgi:stress response protein SCP2